MSEAMLISRVSFIGPLVISGGGVIISQFHNHALWLKVKISGGPLDNQTWQTGWKTLEAFVAASRLYAKLDCPVSRQNFSLLATAHD